MGPVRSLRSGLGVPTVLQWAELALTEARLAPMTTSALWDQLLAGHGPISADDELPELCLPQRLAFRLPRALPTPPWSSRICRSRPSVTAPPVGSA